jgi:hypothetical protein
MTNVFASIAKSLVYKGDTLLQGGNDKREAQRAVAH